MTWAHSCGSLWWCPLPAHHGGWDKNHASSFSPAIPCCQSTVGFTETTATSFQPPVAAEAILAPMCLQHLSFAVISLSHGASLGLAVLGTRAVELQEGISHSTLLLRLPSEPLLSCGQICLRGPAFTLGMTVLCQRMFLSLSLHFFFLWCIHRPPVPNTLLAPHNNTPNPCGSFFFFHVLYFHLLRPKLLTSSPPRPSTSQAFSCTLQVLVLDIPRVLAAAGLISGAGSVFLTTWRALLQSYRFRLRGECRVPNACQKIYIKSENLIPLLTAKAWAWMCFHTKSCVFISSSEKPSPLSLLSTTVLDSPLNFIL